MTDGGTAVFIAILFVVALCLAIAWIMLPFILIATNSELRRILHEQQRANDLLERRLPDLSHRPPRG